MAGSSSSRVILCINKCGLYLNKLKQELADQEDPNGWVLDVFYLSLPHAKNNNALLIMKLL